MSTRGIAGPALRPCGSSSGTNFGRAANKGIRISFARVRNLVPQTSWSRRQIRVAVGKPQGRSAGPALLLPSRVPPTSHFMSATVKKPRQATDWTRQQRCRPCSWGAYIKGNVCATRGHGFVTPPRIEPPAFKNRLGRHLLSCRACEALVCARRHIRLPQPETFRDGHLVGRFLIFVTSGVPGGATHHKSPWRNPHVL